MAVSPSRLRPLRALPHARQETRFLNSANLLTLSRLLLAGLVWIAPGRPEFVLVIVLIAGATDVLDGWIARRRGSAGTTGDWLDPLCDKTFVLSVLAAITWAIQPPWILLVLIAAREIIQLPAVVLGWALGVHRNIVYRAAPIGKAATVAQFAAMIAILFDAPWKTGFAAAAALLGIAAAVHYLLRARRSR